MSATVEIHGLRKRYGSTVAVDDLSFSVRPGVVTGFVGPNGAGKSTTLRVLLGLDAPDAGSALVNGRPPSWRGRSARWARFSTRPPSIPAGPRASICAGLRRATGCRAGGWTTCSSSSALTGCRPPRRPLLARDVPAPRHRSRPARGSADSAPRRAGQRPRSGRHPLDPGTLRSLASEGRVVLVSSHLMSELEDTADHLIVIGRGRLIADVGVREPLDGAAGSRFNLRTPQPAEVMAALVAAGAAVTSTDIDLLSVSGLEAARIGDLLAEQGLRLHELAPHRVSLEEAYMDLTAARPSTRREAGERRRASPGPACRVDQAPLRPEHRLVAAGRLRADARTHGPRLLDVDDHGRDSGTPRRQRHRAGQPSPGCGLVRSPSCSSPSWRSPPSTRRA